MARENHTPVAGKSPDDDPFASALKRSFSAPGAPESLARRIAAQSTRSTTGSSWAEKMPRRRFLAGASLAVAASAAIAIGIGLNPVRPKAASALGAAQASLGNVRTARTIRFHIRKDGAKVKAGEVWFGPDARGIDTRREEWYENDRPIEASHRRHKAGTIRIERDDTAWQWESESRTLQVVPIYEPDQPAPLSGVSAGFARLGIHERLSQESAPGPNGEKVLRIAYPDDTQALYDRAEMRPTGNDRPKNTRAYRRLFLDPKTSLPVRQEYWRDNADGRGFVLWEVIESTFDQPVDITLLSEKSLPDAAKTIRVDDFRDRPNFPKTPLGTATLAGKPVALRSLIGTELGDIVVAYTVEGAARRTWSVALADGYRGNSARKHLASAQATLPDGTLVFTDWFDAPTDKTVGEIGIKATLTLTEPNGATASLSPTEGYGLGGPILTLWKGFEPLAVSGGDTAYELALDRARFFTDGRWKLDKPLVDSWRRDGFDPMFSAVHWYKEALRTSAAVARLRGETPPERPEAKSELAAALRTLGRTREADRIMGIKR